jgi:uncharacterized protein
MDTTTGCPGLISIRPLLIAIGMTGMFSPGAPAIEQMPGPQPTRPPRLEEQWKAKLNANTVSIVAGSPEETYLDITHDLAVLLNDDNLRILPIAGMGGAQNIRDVLYLKGVISESRLPRCCVISRRPANSARPLTSG